MVRIIKCKDGNIFSACIEKAVDAEWLLQEAYYKAQGCILNRQETFEFGNGCNCDHCSTLEHNFDILIEEVIANA